MTEPIEQEEDRLQALVALWLERLNEADSNPDKATERILSEAPSELREALASELRSLRGMADATLQQYNERPGGEVLGFKLQRLLGRGATGRVWQALDPEGGLVALKIIHPLYTSTAEGAARLRTEAKAASGVEHPALVRLIRQVGEGSSAALVTEIIGDGATLADEFALAREAGEGVPAMANLKRLLGALEGVEALHESGIVHLDLKPANILIADDGRLCVTDFGLARIQGDVNLTCSYQVLGTPAYMSPELARGHRRSAGKASDVFSIGAILFEAVTLRPPFRGTSAAEIMQSILNDEPLRLRGPMGGMTHSQVSDLGSIISRALEKRVDHRYEDAGALADDLRRFLNGEPSQGLRPWRKWALSARRNSSALKILGGMWVLLTVGLLLALYQSKQRALITSALSTSSDLVNLLGEKPLAAPGLDEVEALAQLQALVTEGSIGDKKLRGKVLGAMAGLLCDRGLEQEALTVTKSALDLLGEGNPEQRAALYLVEALCHDRRGAEGEAASSALLALELFEESGTERALEHATLARAWAWSNLWLLGRDKERAALEVDHARCLEDLVRISERARSRGKESWAAWVDLKRIHLETRGVEFRPEMLEPVRRVRGTFERMLGTDHTWTLQALYFEANLLFRLKSLEESDALWAILVERARRVAPERYPLLGFALCGRAQAARDLGNLEAANDLYAQSLEVLESSLPPSNRKLRRITIGQGGTLARSGRLDDAVAVYRQSLQLGEKHLETEDYVLMYLRRGLGQALVALGQFDDLEQLIHATWAGLLPEVPEVLSGIAVDEMEHTLFILEKMEATAGLIQRVSGYLEQLEASVPDEERLPKLRTRLEGMM